MKSLSSDIRIAVVGGLFLLLLSLMTVGAGQTVSADSGSRDQTFSGYSLHPKLYDIWYGKKERLYLTGTWALKKLDNTVGNPANDDGTVAGYWKNDYDDSKWTSCLVPGDINLQYPPPPDYHGRPDKGFSGVFWYRRDIVIPAQSKGRRACLFFGGIAQEATVYVNGRLVGTHKDTFGVPLARGENYQAFTLDITDAIRYGERNVIAVRGFGIADRYLAEWGPNYASANERLGIWLPCWIEFTPQVYVEKALLTPKLAGSHVKTRIRIRNATGRSQSVRLDAVFAAYQSYRYTSSHKPAPRTVQIGKRTLKPGLNVIDVSIPLKSPVLWWPDDPFLYDVTFRASGGVLGTKPVSIGRERFGFREFSVSGDRFYLNGKSWFLPGIQPVEAHYVEARPDVAANYDDYLLKLMKYQRSVNIAYIRPHSGHYPWPYQDVADETGMLICAERAEPCEFGKDGKPAPAYRQKMVDALEAYWNHPSVITYSLRNEYWDAPAFEDLAITKRNLDALYDLYKEIDPSRPCAGSSGRRYQDQPTRCDYYDCHDYVGFWHGPITYTAESMEADRQEYYKRFWGVKPFVNGECSFFSWQRSPQLEQAFGGQHPARIDRGVYAATMKDYIENVFQRINTIGLRNQLDFDSTNDEMSAMWHKRYFEQFRYAEGCRGFNIHQSPYHYVGPEVPDVREAFVSGLSPLWTGTATTDRNFYSDRPIETSLLVVNDSRFDLKGGTIEASILGAPGGKIAGVSVRIPTVMNGERVTVKLSIPLPAELPSQDAMLDLRTLAADGKQLHHNSYKLHLVNSKEIRQAPVPDGSVALYSTSPATAVALDSLSVSYTAIQSFDDLDKYKVLIIGDRSLDEKVQQSTQNIQRWLYNGGRILCLEQNAIGAIPWMTDVRVMPAGMEGRGPIMADIIAEDHPAFEGFRWHDFDLWNGFRGQICDNYILPLTDAVLASTMFQWNDHKVGMAVAEYGVGRGLCLVSQVEAMNRFGNDPVASRYLSNLLAYALHDWDSRFARNASPAQPLTVSDPAKVYTIDISTKANEPRMSLAKPPADRSWVLNAANDLEGLPVGPNRFLGVPFDVLKADGPSCIAVGPKGSELPQSVENVLISRTARRLFFLVCAVGTTDGMVKNRARVGTLRIHYGMDAPVATVDVPLVLGENIVPFDSPDGGLLSGSVAWSSYQVGDYRGPDKTVGVSLMVWENSYVKSEIQAVSLLAGEVGAPVLLAISGEQP